MLKRQCSDLHKIFSWGWLVLSSFSIFLFFKWGTSDNIYYSFDQIFQHSFCYWPSTGPKVSKFALQMSLWTFSPPNHCSRRGHRVTTADIPSQICAKLIYFQHVSKTQLRNDGLSSQRSYVIKHVFSSRVKSFQEKCRWVFWNLPGLLQQVCFHSNNRIHCHYC